ncbi:protease SohB [Saccharophagus sp. K07]|uniref:protease SohB n=1 Tax=Saccharophagus sp. K07 TaxID=2283636 RepID=UPI0016526E29|nr:protease SohB [Saccharophagus sp. K07]MBC6906906.1 protease SohB [Saccharophagus sp. K07]
MEFLSEYGLFLAKSVTVVIAILVVVGFIVASAHREKSKEKGRIQVTQLNDRFDEMNHVLKEAVFDEKTLKEEEKKQKEEEKKKKKEEKQARKNRKDASAEDTRKKRVFVLDFNGDVKASATEELRESITAVLSLAEPRDEVVVRLESPGGLVHSYGLAASQLARITQKGIPLTVCVDKVAASGGYMMACVANKILAAPFAVIGSIGVVAQLPNFNRVLKKHDVDYEIFTAGEYKRTVTMFGENTEKGKKKFIEDLEDTHVLFKEFVNEHRPAVNVEEVATGEIWFGKRALEKNLIDGIATSDEYLTSQHPEADIVAVHYEQKRKIQERLGMAASKAIETAFENVLGRLSQRHWF